MKRRTLTFLTATAMGAALFAAPATPAQAQEAEPAQPIVIRRTIPNPRAVEREPLTTDRINTASTRYIDARRGLRPYQSTFGACGVHGHPVLIGYDDHFGITRPEDRPYSYNHREPRTGVQLYTNPTIDRSPSTVAEPQPAPPMVIIIRDERKPEPAAAGIAPDPQPDGADMRIRIHHDKPEMPSNSGAVLITSDGTVIQVGD